MPLLMWRGRGEVFSQERKGKDLKKEKGLKEREGLWRGRENSMCRNSTMYFAYS